MITLIYKTSPKDYTVDESEKRKTLSELGRTRARKITIENVRFLRLSSERSLRHHRVSNIIAAIKTAVSEASRRIYLHWQHAVADQKKPSAVVSSCLTDYNVHRGYCKNRNNSRLEYRVIGLFIDSAAYSRCATSLLFQ